MSFMSILLSIFILAGVSHAETWDCGEVIPLALTGELLDGTSIEGTDCVVIVGSQNDGVVSRVTLCHMGMKTVRVGAGAVPAHLRHGDTLGACPP
jgi:hypothetical protein